VVTSELNTSYPLSAVVVTAIILSFIASAPRLFTSVHPRVWPALCAVLGLIALGFGYHRIRMAADPQMVETTCELRRPAIRERADGKLEVVARLRWSTEGPTPYTSFEPIVIAIGQPEERLGFLVRHRDGARIHCLYRRSRPDHILAGPSVPSRAQVRGVGVGGAVAGLIFILYAVVAWRRTRKRSSRAARRR
jgi:hypothetical protein